MTGSMIAKPLKKKSKYLFLNTGGLTLDTILPTGAQAFKEGTTLLRSIKTPPVQTNSQSLKG